MNQRMEFGNRKRRENLAYESRVQNQLRTGIREFIYARENTSRAASRYLSRSRSIASLLVLASSRLSVSVGSRNRGARCRAVHSSRWCFFSSVLIRRLDTEFKNTYLQVFSNVYTGVLVEIFDEFQLADSVSPSRFLVNLFDSRSSSPWCLRNRRF